MKLQLEFTAWDWHFDAILQFLIELKFSLMKFYFQSNTSNQLGYTLRKEEPTLIYITVSDSLVSIFSLFCEWNAQLSMSFLSKVLVICLYIGAMTCMLDKMTPSQTLSYRLRSAKRSLMAWVVVIILLVWLFRLFRFFFFWIYFILFYFGKFGVIPKEEPARPPLRTLGTFFV